MRDGEREDRHVGEIGKSVLVQSKASSDRQQKHQQWRRQEKFPAERAEQRERKNPPQRAFTKDQTPAMDIHTKRVRRIRAGGVLHESNGQSEDVTTVTREEYLG